MQEQISSEALQLTEHTSEHPAEDPAISSIQQDQALRTRNLCGSFIDDDTDEVDEVVGDDPVCKFIKAYFCYEKKDTVQAEHFLETACYGSGLGSRLDSIKELCRQNKYDAAREKAEGIHALYPSYVFLVSLVKATIHFYIDNYIDSQMN
jgi:hypothetical protein